MLDYTGGKFQVLSSDQIYDIHTATLEVLERTGVLVKEENALRLLDGAGTYVDCKTQRTKEIVREKLRNHHVEPLDASVARGLEEIVKDSERGVK